MKSFDGFGSFAKHLAALGSVAAVDAVNHRLLEQSAVLIEECAKDKIGDYQPDAGQFPAWPELAESTKEDRLRQGYTENDPGLRSGEMQKSIEHQTTSHETHVGSDDDNLVWFENGTSKQPPRSVLGGAAFEKSHEVAELIGEGSYMQLVGRGVPNRKVLIK